MSDFKTWWKSQRRQEMIKSGLIHEDGSARCSWIESEESAHARLAAYNASKLAWEYQAEQISELKRENEEQRKEIEILHNIESVFESGQFHTADEMLLCIQEHLNTPTGE